MEKLVFTIKIYGEVDLLIEMGTTILPIEIKSGKDYTIHNALNNLLSINGYNINNAFVFGETNIEIDNKITYFPIYMIDF